MQNKISCVIVDKTQRKPEKSTRKNPIKWLWKQYTFRMLTNDTKSTELKISTSKCGNCSMFFFFALSCVLITTIDKKSFNCFFDILFFPPFVTFFFVIEIATQTNKEHFKKQKRRRRSNKLRNFSHAWYAFDANVFLLFALLSLFQNSF